MKTPKKSLFIYYKMHYCGLILAEIGFLQIPGFCQSQCDSYQSGKNSYQASSEQIYGQQGKDAVRRHF